MRRLSVSLSPLADSPRADLLPEEKRGEGQFLPSLSTGCTRSVFLTFWNGPARQADLGEHRRIVTKRLVHVRDHLHDLAEERALAVIHHLGDEIRADRLAIGVELDL